MKQFRKNKGVEEREENRNMKKKVLKDERYTAKARNKDERRKNETTETSEGGRQKTQEGGKGRCDGEEPNERATT